MIEFILNNSIVRTDQPPGMPLLDFIRMEMNLSGTKTGCREGDCGACTVMLGELTEDKLTYKTIVSCLTPLGNVQAKHVVSIEGLSGEDLSPVQEAIVNNSGTQCGFCTPGFVVSLVCHSLTDDSADYQKTLASIDGNICRCTGYKSIERAAREIWELNRTRQDKDAVKWMVQNKYLPGYFLTVPKRLALIETPQQKISQNSIILGGGTDLMVQKPDEVLEKKVQFIPVTHSHEGLQIFDGFCTIDAGLTACEMMHSDELQKYIPGIKSYLKLISSTQVRNMGTIGGNIVNASPIGDFTIMLLALDAVLLIKNSEGTQREITLKNFYTAYKKLDWEKDEYLESIRFRLPDEGEFYNFEKVSKREHLDIASVNTAILIRIDDGVIDNIHLSAGGVAPVPLYLEKTCSYLNSKKLDQILLSEASRILQDEISPITDIRGSEEYKRLLLRQLFFAHFIELFPEKIDVEELLAPQTAR